MNKSLKRIGYLALFFQILSCFYLYSDPLKAIFLAIHGLGWGITFVLMSIYELENL
jgi:hypothetical protein